MGEGVDVRLSAFRWQYLARIILGTLRMSLVTLFFLFFACMSHIASPVARSTM